MAARMFVFLKTPVPINAVSEYLATVLGQPLTRREFDLGVVYTGRLLDIELKLFDDHGLEDDCGIPFTEYQHQLELIPLESGLRIDGFAKMYEAVTMFLAATLAKGVGCRSIVVANLQRQLALFEP